MLVQCLLQEDRVHTELLRVSENLLVDRHMPSRLVSCHLPSFLQGKDIMVNISKQIYSRVRLKLASDTARAYCFSSINCLFAGA